MHDSCYMNLKTCQRIFPRYQEQRSSNIDHLEKGDRSTCVRDAWGFPGSPVVAHVEFADKSSSLTSAVNFIIGA